MRVFEIHLKDQFSFLGDNGADPVLTAYLPYNMSEMKWQDKRRPSVLVCPGGGYSMVSQREGEPIALKLLPDGYNVFVLTYSVTHWHFPTQLREVAAAVELIHANAVDWGCDTDRIAIMGFSAGGHLSAHYTNAYDCPEVRAVFPESKAVKTSILCYPVINADPKYAHKGSFKNLIGHKYPMSQEEIEKFSCDRLVSEKTPPTFLWHTANDKTVPVANSLLYAKALAKHKVPFACHVYPKGIHGLSTADDQTLNMDAAMEKDCRTASVWISTMLQWLKDTL